MKIEIGKTYITNIFETEDLDNKSIVKIVGKIPDEYRNNLNPTLEFYSDRGVLYTNDGRTFERTSADPFVYENALTREIVSPLSRYDLVREATMADFEFGYEELFRYSEEELNGSGKFISVDDSSFKMTLGGHYVNVLGLPVFISSLYHFGKFDKVHDREFTFISTKNDYYDHLGRSLGTIDGEIKDHSKCLFDLKNQVIQR